MILVGILIVGVLYFVIVFDLAVFSYSPSQECLRSILHGDFSGTTWAANWTLRTKWSTLGTFSSKIKVRITLAGWGGNEVLSVWRHLFLLIYLYYYFDRGSSGYCSYTLPDARFVRHTVTNLTYLDKVIWEADNLAKMVENCKYLTK